MNPFTLPWKIYLAIGIIVTLAGIGFIFLDRSMEAEHAAALRRAPPAAVAVEALRPNADNRGYNEEVVVIAQADLNGWSELSLLKNGDERRHWSIVPLYPADAQDPSGPPAAVIVRDGLLTQKELDASTLRRGPFGPVLKINGERRNRDSSAQDAVFKALGKRGLNPALTIIIDPYAGGRTAALRPNDAGRGLAITIVVLGLMLIGYGFFRRHREPIEEAAYYA